MHYLKKRVQGFKKRRIQGFKGSSGERQKTEDRRQEAEARGQRSDRGLEGWRVGKKQEAKGSRSQGVKGSSGKRNSWLFMVRREGDKILTSDF